MEEKPNHNTAETDKEETYPGLPKLTVLTVVSSLSCASVISSTGESSKEGGWSIVVDNFLIVSIILGTMLLLIDSLLLAIVSKKTWQGIAGFVLALIWGIVMVFGVWT